MVPQSISNNLLPSFAHVSLLQFVEYTPSLFLTLPTPHKTFSIRINVNLAENVVCSHNNTESVIDICSLFLFYMPIVIL